ncbi:MAG: immune inhibitor A [Dehalococcoidia bacterium]|nr:immune inhibitor A [Dehalococcoidia bacterium]
MKLAVASVFLLFAILCLACTQKTPQEMPTPTPTPTPLPTTLLSPTPSPPLDQTRPLDRDLTELAVRLGRTDGPVTPVARQEPPAYQEGQQHELTVMDTLAPSLRTVNATLRLITPNAYFYFQDDIDVSQEDLEQAGRDFEEVVYPTVARYFGQEWTPGVDSDDHITLLPADLSGLGGYFNDGDEYPRAVSPSSNEREMVYLSTVGGKPGSDAYNGLVAHELQHLVHWKADPTEEVWVNEGLSGLARELASGGPGSTPMAFAQPDTQLNAWGLLGAGNAPHYTASHLFIRYLLEHYGGWEGARRLLEEPANGIEGIDAYLAPFGVTFEDVFADWLVANYLDDPNGGPYSYADAEVEVSPAVTLTNHDEGEDSVHQYGADYIEVKLSEGDAVFAFDGDEAVKAIPNEPHGGRGQWWSGRGDSIDSTLTGEFDLTSLESATLTFWTWYDLEEQWDYAYVMASSDGGSTWQILRGRHTNDENPVGLAYGPAYTGKSGGDSPAWVEESIDLGPFAGQKIILRFEYITDEGISLDGWAIDDIAIPELAFFDGGEGDGPWQTQGFQRLTAPLPQRFIVQVIEMGETTSVRTLPLDAANRGEVRLSGFGSTLDKAVIVVAAASDGTTQTAPYRYSLRPAQP